MIFPGDEVEVVGPFPEPEKRFQVLSVRDEEATIILLDSGPKYFCQAILPIKFLKLIKEFGQ